MNGLSQNSPLPEDDAVDRAAALYGATKRANELMGHAYSHLFGLRVTMLRFLPSTDPGGRPDMALFKFARAICAGEEVEVFNRGDMIRDFTYVGDVVEGILGLDSCRGTEGQPLYDVFNIGCGSPRTLMEFIRAIERALGRSRPPPGTKGLCIWRIPALAARETSTGRGVVPKNNLPQALC